MLDDAPLPTFKSNVEIVDVDSFVFPPSSRTKLNTIDTTLKTPKQRSKIKAEKENMPIHVGSLPHTPAVSATSASSTKKRSLSSIDVVDVRKTKRIRKTDSYDHLEVIKNMLGTNQTEQKVHQGKLLRQMERSNEQYEIQVRNTQEFQTNFLAALSRLAPQN
jgi:hypothetical protein